MTFPVYLHAGPWTLHPHTVFELLAYFVGVRLYLRQRRRGGDVIGGGERWSLVAAAVVGGALGSRILFWLEDPATTVARIGETSFLLGGKTVVGGLLGGLIGVELAKHMLGITRRTGDLFAVPLAAGIAIGRIGCFLTGPSDLTWGVPTSLPWGIDPGTGVALHPSPLYEAIFLAAFSVGLAWWSTKPHTDGWLFRTFMVGYSAFRLLADAIKPEVPLALGLGAIQWACLAALVYYVALWTAHGRPEPAT
jgi:prolipoprotein diacylglyceryltransferase